MVAIAARPGTLSLAAGLPAPEALPAPEYAVALHEVLASDRSALQYGPPHEPLKEQIAALMAARGVCCRSEQIVLTTGAQQAIGIAAKLFLDPGGAVLTEEAIYPGVSQAVAPFSPRVITVRTDPECGMDIGRVEAVLASGTRPAFIYAMADAHNPCGVGLSRAKRWQLVELARRHRVPIVEDDAYGFLGCDAGHPPPLRALDDEWVIYVGTFSKTIAPALRVGWMVLPARLAPSAVIIKEASDLENSSLTQRAVSRYLANGRYGPHLEAIREMYRVRRDAMVRQLQRRFPPGARWHCPAGGFFVWVELPGVDCAALLHDAVHRERVAFAPGAAFAMRRGAARHHMRLSFATCGVSDIEEAVRRLTVCVRRGATCE